MYVRQFKHDMVTPVKETGFINIYLSNVRSFNTVTKANKRINK